jgi:TM2 domain-containing membrane protein YozV
MQTQYVTCPNCRSQNLAGYGQCSNCGSILPAGPMQPAGGYAPKPPGADKKLAAGLCGILLGGFGVHKFILGYQTEGIIMLAIWVAGIIFLCGIPSMVISIIGIVEGVMYLTKSDEEFSQTYIMGKKPWF